MTEMVVILSVFFLVSLYVLLIGLKKNKKVDIYLAESKKEADQIKKEKILQAKEKFIELKLEHEQLINKKKMILIMPYKESSKRKTH